MLGTSIFIVVASEQHIPNLQSDIDSLLNWANKNELSFHSVKGAIMYPKQFVRSEYHNIF